MRSCSGGRAADLPRRTEFRASAPGAATRDSAAFIQVSAVAADVAAPRHVAWATQQITEGTQ